MKAGSIAKEFTHMQDRELNCYFEYEDFLINDL